MRLDRLIEPNHRVSRWLYRGGRPRRLVRLNNRAQAAFQARGLVMPERLVTMEVTGRRTGRTIVLPMVVADLDGERYLVAMLGENANWVRNVRAAGNRAVLRHGRRETVRLEEVSPGLRPPIIRRYLQCAPGARPHIPVDVEAPLKEFEGIAARTPVFRIILDQPKQPRSIDKS